MSLIDVFTEAIDLKKPIVFEYTKFGKVLGERYGHPHCLHIHKTTDNILIHIFQVSGVSDKGKLPGWRTHNIEFISYAKIVQDHPCFSPAAGYNPNSSDYSRVIAKI